MGIIKISGKILAFVLLVLLTLLCPIVSYAEVLITQAAPADITEAADFIPGKSYSIKNEDGLRLLAEKVNAGNKMRGVTFILIADISLNGGTFDANGTWSEEGTPKAFTPIGGNMNPFCGTFDGGGHTVSGLYYKSEDGFVGLFGMIVDGSVVNLTIKDSYVSGMFYVGGIVGYACALSSDGGIKNCTVNVYTDCYNAGAAAGYVIGGSGHIFEVSGCTTVSNSPAVGTLSGGAVASGNAETVIVPEGNKFLWLWLTVIISAGAASVAVIYIALRRKIGNPEAELTDSAVKTACEPEKTSEQVPGEQEVQDTIKDNTAEEPADHESEAPAQPESRPKSEPEKAAELENNAAVSEITAVNENPGDASDGGKTENITPSAADNNETQKDQASDTSAPAEASTPAEAVAPVEASAPAETTPATSVDAAVAARAALVSPSGSKPGVLGYYYIKQIANGGYMFNLKAANHEIIATSDVYNGLAACKKGIQSVSKNASAAVIEDQTESGEERVYAPKFEMYADKTGDFRFRLKAANYEIIAVSQPYKKKSACRNAIDSVIHNAETRKIIVEDVETSKRRDILRAEIVRAKKITAEEADSLLDDTTAEALVETIDSNDGPIRKLVTETVYTDTLSENFSDGDIVNTAALVKKGLINRNTRHIKVLARGTLDKSLTVEANQFSSDAVKMIILTGGNAVRTND